MIKDEMLFPTNMKSGSVELSKGGLTKQEYFALQILLIKPNQRLCYRKEAIQEAESFLEELNEDNNL